MPIFFDWGQEQAYQQAIGVGECAGVAYDVVGTIINDAKEKIELALESLKTAAYADSIYHSYAAFVIGAKALLLGKDVKCNTQKGIINDFQKHYVDTKLFSLDQPFDELVLQLNKNEPSLGFATAYLSQATHFVEKVIVVRKDQLGGDDDKQIIDQYYNA